jgi:hypothetical protein
VRGIVLAAAVGLGIFSWRTIQQYHKPPVPGRLLAGTIVYMLLALLAEYEPATRVAVLAAWGFNVAVLFKAGPSTLLNTAGLGEEPATRPGITPARG